jgi:hypothetical protein
LFGMICVGLQQSLVDRNQDLVVVGGYDLDFMRQLRIASHFG